VIRRILISLLAACLPFAAHAQSSATRAAVGCTYETCALRVEPAFFGAPRLLRGREGVVVGRLGGFGGGVDTLLAGPDSAVSHTRRYVTNVRTANTLGLLSAVAFVVVVSRTDWFRHDADDTDVAVGVTGAALALVAIPFRVNAERHLARAVWFYNAALAR